MKCAECEEAEATLRCVDEDLFFCDNCSAVLHKKRARLHHEVEPIRSALVCDECEDASAEVECFQCGGRNSAMVFCRACSGHLHSRSARAGHHVSSINRLKKEGREKCVSGRIVIDLTEFDSDEENQNAIQQTKENFSGPTFAGKTCIKEEAKESHPNSKVPGTNSGDIHDTSDRKNRKLVRKNHNSPPQEAEGRQSLIASLIKLEDCEKVKEESPEKRQRRTLGKTSSVKQEPKREWISSDSERNESEDEFSGVRRIKRGSVSLEAFVVDADDQEDGPSGDVPENKVEAGIKNRIKNMLELGLHHDTPEFEAQQALKNAQRMLTKHNLQQAEVLKGNLTDTSSLVGGMRMVELRAKGKAKHGRMDVWVQQLGFVIADNFDCQYFFKSGSSSKPLRVVFYGIRNNADCAGYAFAASYNRISTMAAAYVACKSFEGDKENQDLKMQQVNQGTYTRVARTNYRKGIVAGLKEAVKIAQRMRKENVSGYVKRKLPTSEPCSDADEFASCESDGEDSCFSPGGPKQTFGNNPIDEDETNTRMAESCMAITALVLHSQKVGQDFLKQKGIKVRKRTIQSRVAAWNAEAFKQGKKDADTIDINQKSITSTKAKTSQGFDT